MAVGFVLGVKQWATRNLQTGDLTALAAIAGGAHSDEPRIKRLARRGFVAERRGHVIVTPRGRMALMVRRIISR